MNPTGPSKYNRDAPVRPRRTKPHKPADIRTPAQGARRPVQVNSGREFVYASKVNGRPPTRPGAQTQAVVLPRGDNLSQRHLGKVRPGIRRRRNIKMRNMWKTVGGFIGAALLVSGLYFCFTSPAFTITNVEVKGLSAQDGLPIQTYVSKEALGSNIFAYCLTKRHSAASRILSSDPELASVTMHPSMPGTVDVTVFERKPDMLIAVGKDGAMGAWMLDNTGLPIRNQLSARWNERPDDLLKVIVDPHRINVNDLAAIKLGQPLPVSMRVIVSDIQTLQTSLELSQLAPQVESIRIDNSGYLGLNMRSHLLVKLGDISSLDRKLALAGALINQRSDIVSTDRYIDVTDPDWPAVMPLAKTSDNVGAAPAPTPNIPLVPQTSAQ